MDNRLNVKSISDMRKALFILFTLLACSVYYNLYQHYLLIKYSNYCLSYTDRTKDLEFKLEVANRKLTTYYTLEREVSWIISKSSGQHSAKVLRHLAQLEIASAKASRIPLSVGLAISIKESHFKTASVSYNGSSYGVKMINFHAHRDLVTNKLMLFNPYFNVPVGYKILSGYTKNFHGLRTGLEHYYGSNDKVDNLRYANSVLKMSNRIKQQIILRDFEND